MLCPVSGFLAIKGWKEHYVGMEHYDEAIAGDIKCTATLLECFDS